MGAATTEFDLDRALWTIPSARTKSGRTHELTLSPWAVALVRAALADAGGSPWLFPGERSGEAVRRDSLKDHPLRLRKELGLAEFRSHDLRRTVATWLGEAGIAAEVIERVLNHAPQGVTDRHYNHAALREPMRRALDAWAVQLRGIVEGTAPASNVVRMRAGEAV